MLFDKAERRAEVGLKDLMPKYVFHEEGGIVVRNKEGIQVHELRDQLLRITDEVYDTTGFYPLFVYTSCKRGKVKILDYENDVIVKKWITRESEEYVLPDSPIFEGNLRSQFEPFTLRFNLYEEPPLQKPKGKFYINISLHTDCDIWLKTPVDGEKNANEELGPLNHKNLETVLKRVHALFPDAEMEMYSELAKPYKYGFIQEGEYKKMRLWPRRKSKNAA